MVNLKTNKLIANIPLLLQHDVGVDVDLNTLSTSKPAASS